MLNEKGETPADTLDTRYGKKVLADYMRNRMEEHRALQGALKNAISAQDC
jgi:hypothetical protein